MELIYKRKVTTMAKENKEVVPVKPSLMKDGFFGWNNIKWVITEARNIYSNKDSFFSKKRIESGVAFIIMQWGMIKYFNMKYDGMDIYDLILWAGVEAAICGYTLNKIQKEKKDELVANSGTDTPPTEQ